MKLCGTCKLLKELTEYYKSVRDGYQSECKLCACERSRRHNRTEKAKATKDLYRKGKGKDKVLAGKRRNYRRRSYRFYGITEENHKEMLINQKGLCAICKGPPIGNRPLAIDHCHSTGIVRGLLCDKCNQGIGCLKDSPAIIKSALDYIMAHGAVLKPVQPV